MLSVNYISIKLGKPTKQKTPEDPGSKCHLQEPGQPQGGDQRQMPGLEGKAEALQIDAALDPSLASSPAWALGQVPHLLYKGVVPRHGVVHSVQVPPSHPQPRPCRWESSGLLSRSLGREACSPSYLGRWCSDLSRRRTSPQRSWAFVSRTALTGGCHHTRPRELEAGRERWLSEAHVSGPPSYLGPDL